jgi:RND superfamily putative drug exporter
MVLVPSIMEILGPVNWWMPRALDRSIPKIGVEVTPGPVPRPLPSPA